MQFVEYNVCIFLYFFVRLFLSFLGGGSGGGVGLILTQGYFSIDFRESRRERERQRNTTRHINWLPPYVPDQGQEPEADVHALDQNQTQEPSVS